MPFMLRKLDSKNSWDRSMFEPWVDANEIPADPLGELATERNTLSVWHVEDDRSNLNDVLAALVSNRDSIGATDYVLLNLSSIQSAGFELQVTSGDSLDVAANETWHRDIVRLTANRLVDLAKLIVDGDRARITKSGATTVLAQAVQSGRIDYDRLSEHVKKRLAAQHSDNKG